MLESLIAYVHVLKDITIICLQLMIVKVNRIKLYLNITNNENIIKGEKKFQGFGKHIFHEFIKIFANFHVIHSASCKFVKNFIKSAGN